jgi:hypothetical protein
MWVSSQEAQNISKKILTGTSTARRSGSFSPRRRTLVVRRRDDRDLPEQVLDGRRQDLQIRIHPNMPAGTILFTSKSLPYPVSGVGNVFQVRTRQDYYQIEWPLRARRYEYGRLRRRGAPELLPAVYGRDLQHRKGHD